MKKGFFLRLFVLLMLTFFIAEQGRAQTYQRTSQGIKSTVQGINPQIRNYAPNMIQKRKESASLVKRGHSASNVTIKTYKCPLPHHAT